MDKKIMDKVRDLYKISPQKHRKTPIVLAILDGWGLAPLWGGNAVATASTPVFDELWRNYPKTELVASGPGVGLPEHATGNSEAGHYNIGAGRIVHQDVSVINEKIKNGNLKDNHAILSAIDHANKNSSSIHLMGLLSETGTHSDIAHIYPILRLIKEKGLKKVFLHLFSDGRDSDPMSGIELIEDVELKIKEIGVGKVATIVGRFYAMDRDKHWGRTARAYNAIVKAEAETADSASEVFSDSYKKGVTDEFIEPKIVSNKSQPKHTISDNDSVIVFNFRSDRIRQLVHCFTTRKIEEFSDKKMLKNLKLITFSSCGERVCDAEPAFSPDLVPSPLSKVLSEAGYMQYHIAETEKYAHVTYFFNGGQEKEHENEIWDMVPSPKVRTYNTVPKMSAQKVTDKLIKNIKKSKYDFFVVNFANPDMVGHTGNLKAVMQAVSFVDKQVGRIQKEVESHDGTLLICADHGNAEQMLHPNSGGPDTEHTSNPVPFIVVNKDLKNKINLKPNGALSNIAPTILDIMGLDIPQVMKTRESLINMDGDVKEKKITRSSVKRSGIFK